MSGTMPVAIPMHLGLGLADSRWESLGGEDVDEFHRNEEVQISNEEF